MTEVTQDDLKALIESQKSTDRKLEAMMKENKELRGLASNNGTRKLKEITERTATVRMVDDRIVVGFKNRGTERRPRYIYEKPDPQDPTKRVNFVDIILEETKDKKEQIMSIRHEEFLEESEKVKAVIINTNKKKWVINQGSTRKKEMDGYSMVELDFVVDLEVRGVTNVYTLRLPSEFEGREVVIYQDYINM